MRKKFLCLCMIVIGVSSFGLTGCKDRNDTKTLKNMDSSVIVNEDGIYFHDDEDRVVVTSKGVYVDGEDGQVRIDYSDLAEDLGDFLDDVIPDRIIVNVNE